MKCCEYILRLFCPSVSDKEKKFNNNNTRMPKLIFSNNLPEIQVGPLTRRQCYKTFYGGNIPQFHGNTVILCYKATFPWKLPWNVSK